MKKYEILEHKADLKIRVFGKTKEELFENAMIGMQSALRPKIKNLSRIEPKVIMRGQKSPKDSVLFPKMAGLTGQAKIKKIRVKSVDLPALFVDFLSEVLYLTQVNKEIYNKVKFKKFSDLELEAEILGQKVERFEEDIKAVTYYGLDIHQKEGKIWQATVLFDI